ncbi:hypothetical protein OXYTRIMIC_566 [Oxytricha trifallax]|uniref:Uncharacterized protein n=1 Tax=Oxytricha trifallax TaxID=1172189 RepID=A0A073I0C4_9SPIT|nr:hypothetical protein OXYTRIMIC_566 [Oxytricha trifallax]
MFGKNILKGLRVVSEGMLNFTKDDQAFTKIKINLEIQFKLCLYKSQLSFYKTVTDLFEAQTEESLEKLVNLVDQRDAYQSTLKLIDQIAEDIQSISTNLIMRLNLSAH